MEIVSCNYVCTSHAKALLPAESCMTRSSVSSVTNYLVPLVRLAPLVSPQNPDFNQALNCIPLNVLTSTTSTNASCMARSRLGCHSTEKLSMKFFGSRGLAACGSHPASLPASQGAQSRYHQCQLKNILALVPPSEARSYPIHSLTHSSFILVFI